MIDGEIKCDNEMSELFTYKEQGKSKRQQLLTHNKCKIGAKTVAKKPELLIIELTSRDIQHTFLKKTKQIQMNPILANNQKINILYSIFESSWGFLVLCVSTSCFAYLHKINLGFFFYSYIDFSGYFCTLNRSLKKHSKHYQLTSLTSILFNDQFIIISLEKKKFLFLLMTVRQFSHKLYKLHCHHILMLLCSRILCAGSMDRSLFKVLKTIFYFTINAIRFHFKFKKSYTATTHQY